MSNNMAKIADARKTVEQLKLEVNIERMMVGEARLAPASDAAFFNSDLPLSSRCRRPQQI